MQPDVRHKIVATGLLLFVGGVVSLGAVQACGSETPEDKRATACEHVCECGGSGSCAAGCAAGESNSFTIGAFSASVSSTSVDAAACYDCITAASCDALENGHGTCDAQCGG